MKKFFNYFALAAIAALTLAGCSKNDQNAPEKEGDALHIKVKANVQDLQGDPGTKTYISGKTIYWGTGEYMKIAVQGTSETKFATSSASSADVWNGDTEAMFEFTLSEAPAGDSFKYMGMYPASAAATSSNENPESYKVILPAIQNATAASYDPAAYIMIAKPEIQSAVEDEWEASYRRATALNKITLTNISEDIEAVEITADDNIYLAGRRYFNLTTGEGGALYYGQTETITVEYSTALPASDDKVVWFTSWDAEIPVGKTLKIVATGPDNIYTRVLTVTGKPITFKEGFLNTLKVNMSSAEVTSRTAAKTLPYTESFAANFGDFTIDNVTLSGLSAVWTHDSHSCAKATGYVSSQGYETESWLVSPWIDLTSNAVVSFDHVYRYVSDHAGLSVMVITNDASASWTELTVPNWVTNSEWTFGTSGEISLSSFTGKKVKIAFKYTSTADVHATWEVKNFSVHKLKLDPGLAYATASYNVNVGDSFTTPTLTNPNSLTVTYSSSDSDVAAVDETTGAVTIGSVAGSAIITATFAGNDDYNAGSASYTINVIDPSLNTYTYIFTSASWGATFEGTASKWTSGKAGGGFSNNGIQVTNNSSVNGANGTSPYSFTGVKQVVVTYNTNKTAGAGTLQLQVGDNSTHSTDWFYDSSISDDGRSANFTATFNLTTAESGKVKLTANTTTNSIYIVSVSILASSINLPTKYNVSCSTVSHGTIAANPSSAYEGETITLTATPDDNYVLSAWDVKDASNNAITVTDSKFTMPGSNVTVSATFVEKTTGSTTVFMDSFSAISGNVDGDPNVSYLAEKGAAGTDPAVNNGEIRVYQNGGLFTVSANNGYKITSITIGSSMETTVTVSIDGGTASANKIIDGNGTITESGLNASSVKFTCTGTDKSHRLYVNYLSVTYE